MTSRCNRFSSCPRQPAALGPQPSTLGPRPPTLEPVERCHDTDPTYLFQGLVNLLAPRLGGSVDWTGGCATHRGGAEWYMTCDEEDGLKGGRRGKGTVKAMAMTMTM